MKILQISAHYYPNIGGVETHLLDLVNSLNKQNFDVFVLSYRPLTTKVDWKIFERNSKRTILRIPWFPDLFYSLINWPILEFLYLFPGLFFVLPFILVFYQPDIIHSHGLVAGTVGAFWGKIFGKKVVISTHSIYHFPKDGLYKNFVKLVLNNVDRVVCLSQQSAREVEFLGVPKKKIGVFTYWIDLKKFKRVNGAKERLGWDKKFVVLFIGRLIEEKGIIELLEAAKVWNKSIILVIIGSGPLDNYIKKQKAAYDHLIFLGRITNDQLPIYYSAADLLIVPSVHEEGFGRVILESLACGTPVVGSNRGAVPEAMDETVGELIDVSPQSIKSSVESLYKNRNKLGLLSSRARKFATTRFSERNIKTIIESYS